MMHPNLKLFYLACTPAVFIMDEVSELLTTWGLSELAVTFLGTIINFISNLTHFIVDERTVNFHQTYKTLLVTKKPMFCFRLFTYIRFFAYYHIKDT